MAILFVVGSGYIMYMGRPVMSLPAPTQTGTSTSTNTAHQYTLAEVAKHATEANCWSVIGGSVYDLTSWISRHPGGPQAIIGLCGTDGTDAYSNQHGGQRRPQAMLDLLKIGSLSK